MKKFYLFLLLFIGWVPAGWARSAVTTNLMPAEGTALPPSRWQQHADSIFQYLDRSLVSTGLLTNYGFALKDYNQFQGSALAAGNLLQNLGEWRLLYGAMQTSVFNANATLLPLSAANLRIQQVDQQAPNVVSIATLLARYDRFRDDAGTSGLVTVSNGELRDAPNRPSSPYEQRTLVALSPLFSKATTRSPQFAFPSQLLFTNAAPAITALEFDAGEGLGYRPVGWDQPVTATYPANGTYTLRFRLTCANGAVLLSQARFDVNQPPAARYQPAGFANVVTRPSSALFTDTRAYAPANIFLPTYAATGQVTVAYADGNTTGTIRKPLIVIEGYDPSAALRANGLSARAAPDYDYNSFTQGVNFGGLSVEYNPTNPGDRTIFNNQLSEVGQYDLIFLNFDKGTDFIQRNAYLVERLIQWVNDTKQPLNGVRQQNIVMGMSMGGLVARYALRDMEKRQAAGQATFSHDAKLYISHEAPHQGANVPLGVQYAVSSLVNSNLGFGFTAADFSPQLKAFAKLLDEPATQQLLIYQTTSLGTGLHNTWLNEYNTMGYPTQCRNIATSDGSECGRPQSFAPYAELLNIQGSGLLDEPYNGFANVGLLGTGMLAGVGLSFVLGPAALFAGFAAGVIMALGNFEGKADFVVNALPSQQQQRIYHGKFTICKDVLFGLFTTCLVDYSDNKDSDASMLAYDNAPGGIYDLDQVSAGAISQIGTALPIPVARVYVQPQFCFIPTTSALDIGGGSVALGPQNLTAAYSGANRPAPPFSTPFASFVTASRENLTHILWNGLNSKWAFLEMQGAPQVFDCQAFCQLVPAISGFNAVCAGSSVTYTVNAPANTTIIWNIQPAGLVSSSTSGNSITLTNSAGLNGTRLTIAATIVSECGRLAVPAKSITLGVPEVPTFIQRDPSDMCYSGTAYYNITNYDPALTYTVRAVGAAGFVDPGGFRLKRSGSGYVSFTVTARNDCGITTENGEVTFDCTSTYTYAVYPNPVASHLTVKQNNGASTAHGKPAKFTVRLYDNHGTEHVHQAANASTLELGVGTLPAGLYLLRIETEGAAAESRQLQITH